MVEFPCGKLLIVLAFCAATLLPASIADADQITILQNGTTTVLQGEILVEAQDGGVLFQNRQGKLWLVQPNELIEKVDNDDVPKPLDSDELSKEILKELPDGFRVYETKHFVICYNTSKSYAKWIGSLYERLYRGFSGYWRTKRGWKIDEPDRPLPVIVFSNKEDYSRYVKTELGQDVGSMVAYYNLVTNRVVMFDLTGHGKATDSQIKRFLASQNSLNMIATVVHEGTHQLIFNSGIQTRLADTPLWVNEGLAMYFETPDLRSTSGWRSIGKVNRPRLVQFRNNISKGKMIALADLIGDDKVFRNESLASDAYAQAWALNYFLLKKNSKKYVIYLQKLSKKSRLKVDERETRIKDFEESMGKDLLEIEKDFIKYMRTVR